MIVPPLVVDVRIQERDKRAFRMWLPLFLLWPLLLVVVGFAFLIAMVVDVVLLMAGARYHHYTLLLLGGMKLLAEIRGTRAHVRGPHRTLVDVDIY